MHDGSKVSRRWMATGAFGALMAGLAAVPAEAQADNAAVQAGPSTADIVVTAQKRAERLQDTPVPVTVLNTDNLVANNQTRLQDYFTQVPGLSLNAIGDGRTNIVLRGVTTAFYANPTVAVSIDDVPFGSSTALGGGQLIQPDLDPADLRRIEVLRGPQGTLYGASSLGGLIKYVTIDPSTQGFSGRLQADLDGVRAGQLGFGVRGSVNAPLGDTLALRLSAFDRRSPGYVDNVQTGRNDINTIDAAGGRAVLLWKPTATLSVKLGALLQRTQGDGASLVSTNYQQQPTLGDLNVSLLPFSGRYRAEVTLFTANVDWSLGWADLQSVTGYGINYYRSRQDVSRLYASSGTNVVLGNVMDTRKVTQELRLASNPGGKLDWLFGGFYTHERSPTLQTLDSTVAATGAVTANRLTSYFPSTYDEFALFGDVTYHFTDKFNLQAGLRYSHNHQTYNETDSGPLGVTASGAPTVLSATSSDDAVTFLVVPQYRFSRHAMVYARIASGYRPGGPNASAELFGLPKTFDPDNTINYEVGLKGDIARDLTFDLSAYYIDWRKIQLQLVDAASGFAYFTNGGSAHSRGVEGSLQYQPFHGTHLSANASYNLATLAETPPPSVRAANGDRLPYSPRFSGSVSADQDVSLGGAWTGFFGGSVSYLGDRLSSFPSRAGNLRLSLPAYTTLDLRLGARSAAWSINLFARNVTEKRGVLATTSLTSRGIATSAYTTNFIQPRTIGLSVARTF